MAREPSRPAQGYDWAMRVRDGSETFATVPERFRSGARHLLLLPAYKEACRIIEIEDLERRRTRLAQLPEDFREMVKDEVRRLWEHKRQQRQA